MTQNNVTQFGESRGKLLCLRLFTVSYSLKYITEMAYLNAIKRMLFENYVYKSLEQLAMRL